MSFGEKAELEEVVIEVSETDVTVLEREEVTLEVSVSDSENWMERYDDWGVFKPPTIHQINGTFVRVIVFDERNNAFLI